MKKIVSLLCLFMPAVTVQAGEYMTEAEIKYLFTNNTFDIYVVKKDKMVHGYDDADGGHLVYIPWKDKMSPRKWWTDGDTHCTSHPKRDDRCKKMKSIGDGEYEGHYNGKHVVTLSNFREGNQLD